MCWLCRGPNINFPVSWGNLHILKLTVENWAWLDHVRYLEVDVSIVLDVVRQKVCLGTDQQSVSFRVFFKFSRGEGRHLGVRNSVFSCLL